MSQNLIEKIAQAHAVGLKQGQRLQAGDTLFIKPQHILTHDNTSAVIQKFKAMGCSTIAYPQQAVFALDHNVQNHSKSNLNKYQKIASFAQAMEVDFYPAGRGIGHQIMCEEGYAWPGALVVASDSHANMYGALGALGTPVVRTDAAAIWATGQTWWQIPPVVRVELTHQLRPGVTGKDVIIALAGYFNNDEVLNYAIEFCGEGVASLSMDQRMTIANMTTEWGALAGVFPVDGVTFEWLEARAVWLEKRGNAGVSSDTLSKDEFHPRLNLGNISQLKHSAPYADPDAFYAKQISLDLGSLTPHVAGPDQVKIMVPVKALEDQKVKIDKAYLLSCVNSRVEDLAEAATVIKGQKVAEGVELYIAAASEEIQTESMNRGDWEVLLEAGAIPLPAGCGPCIGLGDGLLNENEVGISATNRNFKGRMGAKSAKVYLSSPAIVAASAVAGRIVSPNPEDDQAIQAHLEINDRSQEKVDINKIIAGFPEIIEGELLFCTADNLNTDGIFPGKHTYRDDLTDAEIAAFAMENYDSSFGGLVQTGDILVGGFNFGTGSSREQAATTLLYNGIHLVLAGSFSETYKRNAINNGLLVVEAPELVQDLIKAHGRDQLTYRISELTLVDFKKKKIQHNGNVYPINSVGTNVQELIQAKGLENWVRERVL